MGRVVALGLGLAVLVACDDIVFGPIDEPPLSQDGIAGVREIADTYCMGCHSASAAFGQLDLETDLHGALVDAPSSSGQGLLVAPGDPDASLLYLKITDQQTAGTEMPPSSGGLSTQATDIVKDWILDGAPAE